MLGILPSGYLRIPFQKVSKRHSRKFKQLLSTNEGRSLVTSANPGRPRPYTTSSCLDPSVPGGDRILRKDGRGAYDSLSEGHHRLVERAHYDVAGKESGNPHPLITHVTQAV